MRTNNSLDQYRAGTPEARKIEAALALLNNSKRGTLPGAGVPFPAAGCARLIFALDLTASRELGLKAARQATGAMFDTLKSINADRLAVKLVYYRGPEECKATGWEQNPDVLRRAMEKLSCVTGGTQIERVLRVALAETLPLSGVVFIGDFCEEEHDKLIDLARRCGRRKIPLYIFHEQLPLYAGISDQEEAAALFQQMADVSGGVYCHFTLESACTLRELLSTVAAYSTGGAEAVKQVRQRETVTTPEARQLQNRLLLGAGR